MKKLFLPLSAVLLVAQVNAQERVLSEVTVSAEGSDISERRASATQKTVVSKEAIEQTGGLYVGEVLSKLPGVDAGVPSSDGSVALKSRGMTRDSVQVLIDGERPPGDARHALLIVARMPAGELERIEIVRGASAEFGSASPVVINLVTTRVRQKDGASFKLATGLKETQPVNQFNFTKAGKAGPWSWSVPISISQNNSPVDRKLTRQDSTGIFEKETERGTNKLTELFFGPKLNWKDGTSSFSIWPMLSVGNGQRDTTLNRSDGVTGTTTMYRSDREDLFRRSGRLRLEGETLSDGNKWSGRLALVNSDIDRNVVRDSGSSRSTESVRRTEKELNAALRMDRGWGAHVSAFGLEQINYSRNEQQDFGGSYVFSGSFDAKESSSVQWLQDEWNLAESLSLTTGVRNEAIRLDSGGTGRFFGLLSPSVSGRWEFVDSWVFRSSIGTGIKAPKLDEISDAPVRSVSANSPLEPDRKGNPNLRPEKSVNVELAIEHYWPDDTAVVGANAYFRETENFIERRAVEESGRWVERPYNEGSARHTGVEFDGKLKADLLGIKGGALRAHLTLPRAVVHDERLGITRSAREVPEYILTFGYDQSVPGLSSNFGFLLNQTGKTRTDVASEQWAETKPRSILDLYWVRKVSRTINLNVRFQNVLGENVSRTMRAYSGGQDWQLGSLERQPRTFLVNIEGTW